MSMGVTISGENYSYNHNPNHMHPDFYNTIEQYAPYNCECCGRKLDTKKIVWLELNQNTGLYHAEGELPKEGESQGWFPFGASCSVKQLKETAAKIAGKTIISTSSKPHNSTSFS